MGSICTILVHMSTSILLLFFFPYLDDQSYRFNERKQDDQGRFLCAISTAKDKTLTWKRLTGKPAKK
jgi:hypothetical protein